MRDYLNCIVKNVIAWANSNTFFSLLKSNFSFLSYAINYRLHILETHQPFTCYENIIQYLREFYAYLVSGDINRKECLAFSVNPPPALNRLHIQPQRASYALGEQLWYTFTWPPYPLPPRSWFTGWVSIKNSFPCTARSKRVRYRTFLYQSYW